MLLRYLSVCTVPALALLTAGCYTPPPPQPVPVAQTYTVIPPQAADESTVVIAPSMPPQPMAEAIPPAPSSTVYWIPGHWTWGENDGSGRKSWRWEGGHYVQRPSPAVAWHAGHWQQGSAGYVWVNGYWQ